MLPYSFLVFVSMIDTPFPVLVSVIDEPSPPLNFVVDFDHDETPY